MSLTINLASRGRPDLLIPTLAETLKHLTRDDTTILVSLDEDDPATVAAIEFLPSDPRIHVDVRPREDALGAKYNRVLEYAGSVYTTMADHSPYVTDGFDDRILEAASLFPDGIGVVFNRMANQSFANNYSVTKGLVDKLGWLYPPFFPYWFVDHWVDDIARLIDRVSFADVEQDANRKPPTRELRDLDFWATYFDAHRLTRRAQARDIILSPDFIEPEWRRQLMLRHYPITEFRSQNINDYLREMAAGLERAMQSGDGGERYVRVKALAAAKLAELAPAMIAELGGVA